MSNEEKSVFEKINDSLIAIEQVLEVIATELYELKNVSSAGLPSPEAIAALEITKQEVPQITWKETK